MAFTQPPVGNPMGVQNQVPPTGNPMGAAGGPPNPEVLAQRLMSLAQEAQQIIVQLEAMGINPEELLGGNGQPATPIPQMPQMPVGGDTGGLGGGMPPGLLA
jgi:hypothetical protein